MPEYKTCGGCRDDKPLADFWRNSSSPDGFHSRCKLCAENGRNIETRKLQRSERHLLRRYGLTLDGFDEILFEQNGTCAICSTDRPGSKGWMVDHDHSCCPADRSCGACIRGLLCMQCNVGLGAFKDDPEFLKAALEYLER